MNGLRYALIALVWAACWSVFAALAVAQEPLWPREWMLPCGATYKLRGRIDMDALSAVQSEKNIDDFGVLNDVVGLRRARIGLEGKLPDDGKYVAEIDLAGGQLAIRDLYIGYPSAFEGEAQVGHFREPFSLEGGTSARYFAFMERSPANVLDPARNWGTGLLQVPVNDDSAFAIGAFYAGTGPNDFYADPGSTFDVATKFTVAPIDERNGEELLHFGFAVVERLPLDGDIVINQNPRSPLLEFTDNTTSVFLPQLIIPASFQHTLNAQMARVSGPWWMQAEWYGTFVDQTGGGTVFYDGMHVDIGYFVTGEHREYNKRTGVFGPVRVNRPFMYGPASYDRSLGPGAWEMVARFAWIDFFDPGTPVDVNGQPQGIQMPQMTAGANWYLTDRLRIMFNYTYAAPIEPINGQSTANIFGTRVAFDW